MRARRVKREYGGGTRHRNFNYAIPYNYIIYLETSIFAFSAVLTLARDSWREGRGVSEFRFERWFLSRGNFSPSVADEHFEFSFASIPAPVSLGTCYFAIFQGRARFSSGTQSLSIIRCSLYIFRSFIIRIFIEQTDRFQIYFYFSSSE